MSAADLILAGEIWLALGAVVAVAFLGYGIDRVEPNAHGGYFFRALVFPGVCLLWPIVIWRWWLLATDGEDWQSRHSPQRGFVDKLGFVLAAGIFAILVTAALVRPTADKPPAAERLGAIEWMDRI